MRTLFIAITALSFLMPYIAGAQERPDSREVPDLESLQEQIEIMRLVLASSINTHLAEMYRERNAQDDTSESEPEDAADSKAASGVSRSTEARVAAEALALATTYAGSGSNSLLHYSNMQFTSHTRGFYAPGYGVFLGTAIAIPVTEIAGEDDTGDRRSEWEKARRQVQEQSGSETTTDKDAMWVLDADYIEAATDVVLECFCEYGMNIEDLPSSEHISMAIRFDASPQSWSWPQRRGIAAGSFAPLSLLSSNSARSQNVVIQLKKSHLAKLGDCRNRDSLRANAQVTRYGDPLVNPQAGGHASSTEDGRSDSSNWAR